MSDALNSSLRILNRNIRDAGSPLKVELDKDGSGWRPSVNGHFLTPRMSAKECERFLDGAASMLAALRLLTPNEDSRDASAARAARSVLFPGGDLEHPSGADELGELVRILRPS